MSQDDLHVLLEEARRANTSNGITGILLFENGYFFQVLEGPATAVVELYNKIRVDPRHHTVTKLVGAPIQERTFTDWSMGYPGVTREALLSLDGLNDFFGAGKCFLDLDEGRAKTLMLSFKEGNLRA